jgi:hypothetical protein
MEKRLYFETSGYINLAATLLNFAEDQNRQYKRYGEKVLTLKTGALGFSVRQSYIKANISEFVQVSYRCIVGLHDCSNVRNS